MKKVLFTLAVVLGMATAAQAQLVIGGGINFNGGTNKTSLNGNWGDQAKFSNFGFGIAPTIAYDINDNMEVGATLSFSYNQRTRFDQIANVNGKEAAKSVKDNVNSDFSWSINPYFRYRLFDVKGFGFWLQAKAELGTSLESKTKYYAYGSATEVGTINPLIAPNGWRSADEAKELNQPRPGHKYSRFNGAGYIQPVLTYGINEHWIIYSELDLLSVGVWGYVEKTTEEYIPGSTTIKTTDRAGNETPITETVNSCNFNLGLFQGRAITLGVVYKF